MTLQAAQQRTGLWQKFNDVAIEASKDANNVRLEIGPGYRCTFYIILESFFLKSVLKGRTELKKLIFRVVNTGGVEASWSCPNYAS